MSAQVENQTGLFIPIEVVRWLLQHRRRRLAAEAKQKAATVSIDKSETVTAEPSSTK